MKEFLFKIGIWGSGVAAVFAILIGIYAGPRTDYFYNRFTRPKSGSLILGSSRAAQGIIPSVLKPKTKPDLFNYSFTNYNSPFGPCYLAAAKKKFNARYNGIFIIEVNPFTVSNYKRNMRGNQEEFEECDTPPANMITVDVEPNYEYIIRNYSEDLRSLIGIKQRSVSSFLHDDGWLEIEMEYDTAYFKKNTEEKVKNYEELIAKMQPSHSRWRALKETISYFKEFGQVILVRVPVSKEMEVIEHKYYEDFEEEVLKIAEELKVAYLNYFHLNDSLYYTDGNHLHRGAAQVFSQKLANDLSELENPLQ